MINLDLRHLRTIVAVAEENGFGAAAARLRVAQSAVSRTVMEAERRAGVVIFDRTTRRVSTTPDGAEVIAAARRLLTQTEAGLAHIEGYLHGRRGHVSVAALPSLAAALLPGVLARYRAERPEVAITVRDGLSGEVLEMVSAGLVDMAITVSQATPPGLDATRIAADRFSCVLPPGHRLTDATEIGWSDLAGEPFVHFDPTSSIRAYVEQELDTRGVASGPVTEARNISAVAGLVAAGLGVSVVPSLVLPLMRFAGIEERPLGAPVLRRVICLVVDPQRRLALPAQALRSLLLGAAEQDLMLPEGVTWLADPRAAADR